ncbi:MAG: MarR family winged helix-turn-helix transcriptional regulator [Pseudomonadota bacterium]
MKTATVPLPPATDPAPGGATPSPVPGYVLGDQVGHLIRRAHQRHTAIFQDRIGDAELTCTQFAALVKIMDLGQVSQNRLGRLTAMDPATIQGVIQRLQARGLIARHDDPADRRLTRLRLTAPGLALARAAIARARAASEATLAPLAPGERKTFLALLRRLA